MAWQVGTVDLGSRADCLRKFQSNHYFGMALFAALVAGRLLLAADDECEGSAHGSATDAAGKAGGAGGRPPLQPRTMSLLLEAVRG